MDKYQTNIIYLWVSYRRILDIAFFQEYAHALKYVTYATAGTTN